MRLRACLDLKMATVPAAWVQRVAGWNLEKKRRFILIDNFQAGENDFSILANEWDMCDLLSCGFTEDELTGLKDDENESEKESSVCTCSLCGHTHERKT